MKVHCHLAPCRGSYLFILICILSTNVLFSQQTSITDYVIFGGQKTSIPPQTAPLAPGYAVQLGSSCNIQGGSIGSYNLVKSTGNLTLGTNIYSGGTIQLANSNMVTGKITAANLTTLPSPLPAGSTILSIGSSTNIAGNIDVNGNILIGGGTVSGIVTHPSGTTYSGPVPGGGNIIGQPTLPGLPDMPAITNFPGAGSTPINATKTILAGSSWGDVTLGGNKTLTLSGTGVYVFNSIKNSGTSNDFVFDFKNQPGTIKIYVHGDVDLGKVKASIINDGGTGASRIYFETHGKGTASNPVAFNIANGSSGSSSKWLGSVWAPYAAINVGSGTGSTDFTGALWSGTQVNIQSGVSVIFAPFTFCSPPNANAGIDKPLDFSSTLTTLTGTSTTPGVSFNWQAINGGIITSSPNAAAITVSVAGTYVLAVSSAANCFATDSVVVTSRLKSLIGSELQSIYDNKISSSPFFVIRHDSVMIDVIANAGFYSSLLNLLQNDTASYGLRNIISNGASSFIITGNFPVNHLPNLNLLITQVNYCRPYYQAFNNIGLVSSAGDTAMRSNLVRTGYKVNGDGIKIGVISDSYATITAGTTATLPLQPITAPPNPIPQTFTTNTAAQDVVNGDLPGIGNPNGFIKNVHVIKDFPIQRSDEGRAMLQIVHDVAPGAELYFRTGFFTPGDFAIGINELKDNGCNIIVDDVTFITEPFLKDGVVAKAVDAVKDQGVAYFSAAGNFANTSYEKDYNPVLISTGVFAGKMAHNFGGGDMFQHLRLAPGNYTFVLQWKDSIYSSGQSGTINDVDFYLTPNTDPTSLFGFNRDNTNGDPIEFIPFTVTGTDSIDRNIFIVNNTTTSNPSRIKYIVFRGGVKILEYNEGTSTLVGQANASGAIAVGAARYDKVPPYLNPPILESFSSIGGTQTNGIIRNKPDFVGPDGVNTTVKLGQDYPNSALDGYSNFFGTSAAAPHAAATAALIMQAKKKFLNQAITTPTEIRTLLQSTAVDMGTPGFDFSSGYGFINIDLALRTFAAPTPAINQLLIPVSSPITIPGESVFTLTVKGENFSNNSIIYFNDSALASTVVLNTNEATAVIPKFEGNPGIRIYTPPYPTTNGLDGGFSNTLYFFEADITVTAVNLTKKYGQQLPALDTIIKINGVLLQDTTLTLAGLGLSSLTLTTPATINSNVGTYIITPSRIFDENSPADVAFLQKYNYTFTSGTLTIEKLPLKVTPEDKTITYGQYIGNVTFKYEFDPAYPPANAAALTDTIKKYHNAFLPNNALALIKDFSKTQSNGSHLTAADLANMSIMATLKAVKNSRKFKLENNELVPTTNLNSINVQYLVDIASESIFDYKANPALAKFYNGYPGYSSKALLGETPLANNTAGIEITNGGLVSMINGSLAPMINTTSGASLVPLLNGGLVYLLNGSLATLVNGVPALIPNSPQIQLANGGLVYLLNGEYVPIVNGGLVSLLNGQSLPITSSNSYVELPNNYGVLHLTNSGELAQLLNGAEMPLVNASNVVQLTDGSFAYLVNGSLVSMINGTLVSLLNGGLASLVNGGLATLVNGGLASLVNTSEVTFTNGTLVSLLNSNSVGAGTVGNNTAVIIDETDVDLQTSNWLGNMFGINMITGLDVGQQSLIPGVLVNANFEIMYGLGTVTITPDPCLIAHSPDKNFGSSSNPGTATSLWLNLVTKISGQLKKKDDYLLFKSGTITFNNIVSTPLVTDFVIPTGKIIADNISVPFTKYDAASNTWITKVPVGFSSTSDIFITGAIINSSTGFVKNNNANTVVKGKFYSNLNNFKDQWAYASAAYQPQFTYASIADSGQVTTINGMYRAGTPTTQIAHLVNGGSGGGGNNYSGSTNSYDKFTACVLAGSPAVSRVNNLNQEEVQNILSEGQVQIIPNPATNYITLSFVPTHTGSSEIMLFTIDGKKIFETKNGICEAGIKYYKKIDVSKLISGVYIVQLRSTDKTAIKKIIISR